MLNISFPFLPVTFITGTEKLNSTNNDIPNNDNYNNNIHLDGNVICEFYKEIINIPSTSSSKYSSTHNNCNFKTNKESKNVKKPITCIKIKPYDIFRYAETGDLKGMEECLKSGIDINCTDNYGWTPLMCAACSGSLPMVKYLVKNAANRDLCNLHGKKAIDLALQFKHDQVIKFLQEKFVEVKCKPEEINPNQIYFCKLCQTEVDKKKQKHESSIVHQLNIKRYATFNNYFLPENNKGFQIMLKNGWNRNNGLGPNGIGNKYPVKTILKQDRLCLGSKKKYVPRITHFKPFDDASIKTKTEVPVKTRHNTLKKREYLKEQRKKRMKEINFRREFY